ncbi:hypothetical protein ACFQZJ_00980 [Maribacter chungangensis]|uniref:GLPGLI family protein n=1 Tax=Maribacter chungangensis TaxID=1069117 RepID=A0ABW3AYT7_9FLAO
MTVRTLLLVVLCYLGGAVTIAAQTQTYYTIKNNAVVKTEISDIQRHITFETKEKETEEALSSTLGVLATNLIPLLFDGASKLFYNPDNFNKEYFASYSFFDSAGYFEILNPASTLVFEQTGKNEQGKTMRINRFEFELGNVKNVDGYLYLGLKAYELQQSWSKLNTPNNQINYVLDIGFYYFDNNDKAQEFHINPFLLDAQTIGLERVEIPKVNFQVIPKMKVLQNIQVRIREVNAKTQNWNRYLELYQSNQGNLSRFLIRAINK